MSVPRFDAGESAIGGVEGGERRASHKPSAPTMAEGLSPWRWHKGVFLVLVLKTKMAQPTNPVECVQSLTQKHVAKRYMIGEKFLPLRHES